MLLTRIPFFRDVIVMSFSCDECGFSNSELQPASDFGVKACRYELKVNPSDAALCRQDLNRQVVKSENASIYITELQFEIPPTSKRGDINTVEGIIDNARTNLESGQVQRRQDNAELADKLQVIIDRLRAMSEAREPFTFILDDIGGNSFLENPYAPNPDRRVTRTLYSRNAEQNVYSLKHLLTNFDTNIEMI
jgi:zinc finger protein